MKNPTTTLLLLLPLTAYAQPSAEDIERYQKLTSSAGEAFHEQDFQTSIRLLEEARTIHDHPDLIYNIARSHEAMGYCARAEELFSIYLNREDLKPHDKDSAQIKLKDLAITCTEHRKVTFRCMPGTLNLSNENDEFRCHTPMTLQTGHYQLTASAPEHMTSLVEFQINTLSTDLEISVILDPIPAAPPAIAWKAPVGWTLTLAGTALIIGGLVLDATSTAPDSVTSSNLSTHIQDAENRKTLITALYIGGLTTTIAGAGLLTWHYTTENTVNVGLSPLGARLKATF